MSDKFKTVVTTQGLELLNQAIANEKDLLITKAVASSTAYNSDRLLELTDTNYNSASHDQETTLNRLDKRGDGSLAFEILFDGYDVRYDYTLNTVFLIAEVDGKERLFAVIKANQPQYINAYEGGSRTTLQINFGLQLANQNVAIKINAAALATLNDLEKAKETLQKQTENVQSYLTNKIQENKADIEDKLIKTNETLQVKISNAKIEVTQVAKDYSDRKNHELDERIRQEFESAIEQLNNGILLSISRTNIQFQNLLDVEKNLREHEYNALTNNISEQIQALSALEKDIQQSFYNKRRAPTGWSLDRTTTPWTIWFDNGCGIQFPDYDQTGTVYGYGYSFQNSSANKFAAFPLVYNIINCARGVLTLEDFVKRDGGDYIYWSPTTKVLDPIQDARKYNWTNAFGAPGTNNDTFKRKPNFARVMYELGIWNDDDVVALGARKV